MDGFDWDKVRQRRSAGLTNATQGHQSEAHKDREDEQGTLGPQRNPREKGVWGRSKLPRSTPSHNQSDSQNPKTTKHDKKNSQASMPQFYPNRAENRYRQPIKQERESTVIRLTDFVSLQDEDTASAKITDCEYVGSYNWLDAQEPTILTPGAPPIWTPIRGHHQLKRDKGQYFRDQNSARWPKHPLEPAIRAVFDLNPRFNPEDIDIVTCAGTIGNIYKFASSLAWTFKFDMQKVGNTIFMVRKERKPDEIFENLLGYGHTFPEVNTSWDRSVKGSVSHQRIIRYKFSGLNLLVRYEADGYFPDKVHKQDEPFEVIGRDAKAADIDTLIGGIENHDVAEKKVAESGTLHIRQAGFIVPQDSLFDIKTRNQGNEIDLPVQHPRLWVRQMKNFIIAYHKNGLFGTKTQIHDISTDIETWEQDNSVTTSLVGAVLKRLIAEATKSESGKLEISRNRNGPLIVQAQDGGPREVLPADLKDRWGGNGRDGEEEEVLCSDEEWDLVAPEGRDLLLDH
ncbi:uncharacterized protein CIMG_05744 [Coccidioides immitis RS]|uniref:Geranylgeranyl pyrophosphate synthetase n=1 Tax=Coccidioides immitis (strain RS) TaxID=246410 RepID=J3K6P1_COCIM|nr:uncharacterized protein CIMG_05744 [Coccidioides immitis RS]EAS30265.3 hypothetical protein CIMG_05744 [Coccidioides immitis RS]